MKQKLLFTLFTVLFSIIIQAQPTASVPSSITICPENRADITITGTPNCIVTITNTTIIPYTQTVSIGPSGTAIFSTPILQQTTIYTLTQIRDFFTQETTILTGVSCTVNVVPNGCTRILTDANTGINALSICNIGECKTLTANPTNVPSTSSYEVSSIPYCPQAEFLPSGANQVSIIDDDIWSSPIPLPFNFSFFNQNYTSCQVGTNGLITFNPQAFPGNCGYEMSDMNIPNPAFIHKNAIFGVFQDTDTRVSASPEVTSVNWMLTGTYPCRKLIVNFSQLGQFNCGQSEGMQSYQIVLYEVSNIIEVYIKSRTRCTTWEGGDGVVGIINSTGSMAFTPPGRNVNDNWTATNEAWRFTPNGPNVPVNVIWKENGNNIGTGNTITVCPVQTTNYVAEATYQISGVPFVINNPENIIMVSLDQTQQPVNITACYDVSETYTVNLTSNDAIILGSLNPANYEIGYFRSLEDAEDSVNPITDPVNYTFTNDQTIYAQIYKTIQDCTYIKPFDLIINPPVNAPSAISPQTLYAGQTLADVIVTGDNIRWYDQPDGGNLLPISTVLQNNTTYYASQMINSCESKMATMSSRIAILVQVALGASEFDRNAFSFHPNPTSDILTITSTISEVKLDVYNALSQKIDGKTLKNGANTIDMTSLASGVYIFQLSLDGKIKTYKIIKN